MSRPKHRNAVRKLGENETIIYNALKTSDPTEMLRVQFQHHQGKAGYAIEVTRDVLGEPYVYTGWFSIKAFKTDPWPADQRHMIDRSFEQALAEILKQQTIH